MRKNHERPPDPNDRRALDEIYQRTGLDRTPTNDETLRTLVRQIEMLGYAMDDLVAIIGEPFKWPA